MISYSKKTPYFISVVCLFLAMKLMYRQTETSDLDFLLMPVNKVIKLLTGLDSIYSETDGYFFNDLQIVIGRSCSGFNLWLVCLLMLSFFTINNFNTRKGRVVGLASSLVGSYVLTILINSIRIFTSINLATLNLSFVDIDQSHIHEGVGVFTNMTFLMLTYLIIDRYLKTKNGYAQLT